MATPRNGVTGLIHLPDDFVEHAHETNVELAARYGISRNAVARLRRRNGFPPAEPQTPGGKNIRPVPTDFVEVLRREGRLGCRKYYEAGDATIVRWMAVVGVQSGRRNAIMPDDFAAVAPTMVLKAAAAHYAAHTDTIRRWEKVSGVSCQRVYEQRRIEKRSKPAVKASRKPYPYRPPCPPRPEPAPIARTAPEPRKHYRAKATRQPLNPVVRDMSEAGRAADFLRRWCPVYRCNEAGAQTVGGSFWRVGLAVVTPHELIERADRKGWVSDAWQRIAA